MSNQLPASIAQSDAELVESARRGDAAAWRQLIRRHTPMVHRLSARMLGAGADAEDACQEAFMKMHRAIDSYDTARPLGPWLGRITYHVCLKRLGAAKRGGPVIDPSSLAHVADERAAGPERAAASRQTGQLVTAAMSRLSAQDRALVTLSYRDGLTDAEVSVAVGMNRNTVRTRLHRARQVLRRALTPVLGSGGGGG